MGLHAAFEGVQYLETSATGTVVCMDCMHVPFDRSCPIRGSTLKCPSIMEGDTFGGWVVGGRPPDMRSGARVHGAGVHGACMDPEPEVPLALVLSQRFRDFGCCSQ